MLLEQLQLLLYKIPFLKKVYLMFFGGKRYRYLFSAIKKNKCRKIMEIGVWDGAHALQMINEAKKYQKNIEYYGFDLFEDFNSKKYSLEVAKKPPTLSYVKNMLEKTNCQVNLYKGDTFKTLPKYSNKLPKMDLIFIDGGHSLKTIENDWKYSQKLLNKNTIVLFDDYWNRGDVGCKNIIKKIDRKKYKVKVLPIQDKYKKDWGTLKINFVKVQLKN